MSSPPLSPTEPYAATEAELERLRARLQTSLDALESRIHQLRDWRSWLRRHPWLFLGGACAAGAMLGLRRGSSHASVTAR